MIIDPIWKIAISRALAHEFGERMPPDLLNRPALEPTIQRLIIDCKAGGFRPDDLNSGTNEMSPAARGSWVALVGLVRDATGKN